MIAGFNVLSWTDIELNSDTTSFHVDGEYSVDDDFTGIRLTKGYSCNHRPELNQVMLNQAGIPVYMKAHSGNKNDTETFKKLIKSHIPSLKASQKSRYWIGDSALYVAETLNRYMNKNNFLLPESHKNSWLCIANMQIKKNNQIHRSLSKIL